MISHLFYCLNGQHLFIITECFRKQSHFEFSAVPKKGLRPDASGQFSMTDFATRLQTGPRAGVFNFSLSDTHCPSLF